MMGSNIDGLISSTMVKISSLYSRHQVGGVTFTQPTLAQQHFRSECDINTIMDRYTRTGFLTDPLNPGTSQPQFDDFSNLPDYHEAMTAVANSNSLFMQLPSKLRARFSNDPGELLAFLADSDNREEAIKLGLIPAPPLEPAVSPSPTDTASTTSKEAV